MKGVKYATEEERAAARKKAALDYYYRHHEERKKAANARGKAGGNRRETLRKYGLTQEQYELVLASQGGVCAICKGPPVVHNVYHIDHDHKTGLIRGLLCQSCNTGIGKLKVGLS